MSGNIAGCSNKNNIKILQLRLLKTIIIIIDNIKFKIEINVHIAVYYRSIIRVSDISIIMKSIISDFADASQSKFFDPFVHMLLTLLEKALA